MMVDIITYLSKCIECMVPRVNPKVNYGLWVILLCQARVINYNKRTTVVGDVDSRRGCECVGGQKVSVNSVLSAQFCCEPTIGLKK